MTKKEARAILACKKRIEGAIAMVKIQLTTPDERSNCENYWGGNILHIMQGGSYGAAPISRAEDILNE
jgi:hypothetical protein